MLNFLLIVYLAINCDDMLSAGAARIVCSGLADARETGRYALHCTLFKNVKCLRNFDLTQARD